MKTSLRVWLVALAAGLSFFVAPHAALGWRSFAQVKERKNPTPTPAPQPVRTPAPVKVIRPTPTPRPRPAPSRSPIPLPSLASFSFGTEKLAGDGRVTHLFPGQAFYFVVELGNGATLEMVGIPGGSFMMGAPATEAGRHADEGPLHRVDAPPFWMAKFEITQKQWLAVMGRFLTEPGFRGDELPVEKVSWDDAQAFLRELNRKLGLQNKGRQYQYRLPSEAEWEYAARAGTDTPFAFGETITPQVVNYNSSYPYASAPRVDRELETIEVGSLGVANAFGLFDMHGNVWEWCEDVYHKDYNGAPADGSAWLSGGDPSDRTMRGGSWNNEAVNCRSAERAWVETNTRMKTVGFRVAVSTSAFRDQSLRE
jgi:formylglycine-generating enzyme required for sulfatase activity